MIARIGSGENREILIRQKFNIISVEASCTDLVSCDLQACVIHLVRGIG